MISVSDLSSTLNANDSFSYSTETELIVLIEQDKAKRFFIQFTNSKGNFVEPNISLFRGKRRDLIEEYLNILRWNQFNFSWGTEQANYVYCDENPDFIRRLFISDFPIWFGKQKKLLSVEFDDSSNEKNIKTCDFFLKITKNEEESSILDFAPTLKVDGDFVEKFTFLNGTFVVVKNKLYNANLTNSNYDFVEKFRGQLPASDFQSALTIFASHFPDAKIAFADYTVFTADQQTAQRALQFNSIDEDGNLNIKFLWSFEGFDPEFITSKKPQSIVQVRDDFKQIIKTPVSYAELSPVHLVIEGRLRQTAKNYQLNYQCYFEDDDVFIPMELASAFLTENLGFLSANYQLFGTDALKKYKLKTAKPKISFKVKSGINFFESLCTIDVEGQEFSFDEAAKLYEENNFIPLNDGSKAIVDHSFFAKLQRLLGKKNKNGTYNLSFFDMPFIQQLVDAKISGEGFDVSKKIFEGFNSIGQEVSLEDCELNGRLRGYQNYGVKWMKYLAQNNLGGCLADDMGLGKTVQVIALLREVIGSCSVNNSKSDNSESKNQLPSIIVVPKSLVSNWQSEFQKFAPQINLYVYYGGERNFEEIKNHQVVITTYAVLRNDIQQLQDLEFNFAILDEIQTIKNLSSQITKAAMLINAKHRFGLSGTPMENHLGEIYSIFRFINPPMFGSEGEFSKQFMTPIQKNGDEHAAKILACKLNPFILRRLKKDVATELPEKTENILYVQMNDEQTKLYEQRRKYYEEAIKGELKKSAEKSNGNNSTSGNSSENGIGKAGFLVLQGLTELRQLATCPETKSDGSVEGSKWELLVNGISDLAESGHKCLIFTNFISCVETISQKLTELGIEHLTMTGATNDRASLVKKFQNDENCKAFIMTLKTGGVGLNLTAADYVYIVDPWWNTSAEQQAIDRTHRIGQTKNVFCYRIIAKNTIEEKILELQNRKKDLFASVISTDSQAMKNLTVEDINYLLEK